MYTERLRGGEEDRLKVHCYRALLEKLLVSKDPGLRHTQLKTVARAHQLDVPTYVRQASLVGAFTDFLLLTDPNDFICHFICRLLVSWM